MITDKALSPSIVSLNGKSESAKTNRLNWCESTELSELVGASLTAVIVMLRLWDNVSTPPLAVPPLSTTVHTILPLPLALETVLYVRPWEFGSGYCAVGKHRGCAVSLEDRHERWDRCDRIGERLARLVGSPSRTIGHCRKSKRCGGRVCTVFVGRNRCQGSRCEYRCIVDRIDRDAQALGQGIDATIGDPTVIHNGPN